ncbi:Disintegrin and metalloproteinase domain-containing protein B [Podosphaera aphanis]|nr:Disintegrin and metalloproteinase domain-containing protein B [Podosphaera aphanis]
MPNNEVIQEGATVQYMAPDGTLRASELLDRNEYKVFKGDVWLKHYENSEWTNVGWARIIVQRDGKKPLFEGAFRVDGDHHHIQTRTHFMQTRHKHDPKLKPADDDYLVVWRDSDISQELRLNHETALHSDLKRRFTGERSCSADGLSFNTQSDHPVYQAMKKREESDHGFHRLFGRQIDGQLGGNSAGVNLVNTIGSTAGCPSTRKVALVGVATDCTYSATFKTLGSTRANIISVINSASHLYESTFNITLGLQNLTISDPSCPTTPSGAALWNIGCSDSVNLQDRLNLFSAWRGDRKDNNAFWTLLSTCGSGTAVGLAWLGQACVATAQVSGAPANETVSGANVVVRTATEWQVVAHEIGHTFGAVHDCTSSTCNDGATVLSQKCCPLSASTCDASGAYIMNPSTGANIQLFSPCTVGNICSAIGRNSVKTSCLTANKDITTITGSQCGNGIVEPGEDCDCGGTTTCGSNPCCDPTTCKFKANAVCDPSNEECCNQNCQLASTGTVCRASTGVCDPEELCSGTSATCPEDANSPDGTKCGDSSLSCASGQCTSRDLQCKTLMGVFTQGNDTYACSNSGCQISCASPEFGPNVCYSMQQNFLDGTSCQGGGKCANGQCLGASVSREIKSWVQENKTLVIILATIFGGLFSLIIISSCVRNLKDKKRRKKNMRKQRAHPNASVPPYPTSDVAYPKEYMQANATYRSYENRQQSDGWWDNQGNWIQQPQASWQNRTLYK